MKNWIIFLILSFNLIIVDLCCDRKFGLFRPYRLFSLSLLPQNGNWHNNEVNIYSHDRQQQQQQQHQQQQQLFLAFNTTSWTCVILFLANYEMINSLKIKSVSFLIGMHKTTRWIVERWEFNLVSLS